MKTPKIRVFISTHKIAVILISIFILVVIALLVFLFVPKISGSLLSYNKMEDYFQYFDYETFSFDASKYMDMPDSTINDFWTHKDKYSVYLINYKIENTTDHTLYDLEASLDKQYNNLWFDITSIGEGEVYLEPREIWEDNCFVVIIKSEDLSTEQIDSLIRNIHVVISGTDFSPETDLLSLIRNSITIGF